MNSGSRAVAPLKVLHVCRILDRELTGGIHSYLECVRQALDQVAVEMHVAATWYGHAKDHIAQCDYAPAQRGGRLQTAYAFQRWLAGQAQNYDVVHLHGIYWTLLPALVCRRQKIPYVVSPHGSLMPWELNNAGWHWLLFRHRLGRGLLRDAQAVIATSELDAQTNRQFESGLRMQVITPAVAVPAALPSRQQDRSGPLQIVTVGRIEPVKRIPFLLEVMAALKALRIDAHLHVIGSGARDYQDSLCQQVEQLGLQQQLSWHGYLTGPALSQQVAEADVFMLGSLWENFSFATAEAMAQGVPVVVSQGVGLAQLVQAQQAGDVLPMLEPQETAERVARYQHSDYREARAQAAYHSAREHLSYTAMGQALQACYRAAVDRQTGA